MDFTIFPKKKLNSFFAQVEKNTLKSCSEKLKSTFFSLTASTAQMSQTEDLMFQNVAYRPTVYITGSLMKKKVMLYQALLQPILALATLIYFPECTPPQCIEYFLKDHS